MLNMGAGIVGLAVQLAVFIVVYLLIAPSRGRSLALLFAAVAGVYGYGLVLAGLAAIGLPWQITNLVCAVVLVIIASTPRVRRQLVRSSGGLGRWTSAAWPSAAIIAALVAIQVLAVVITPELSIDGQLYHGPILAQLLQTGTLWGWHSPNQYMFYTDLTMMGGVNLAAFTGATVFDNGIQLPHLVILLLALNVMLARRFSRPWVRVAFGALIVSAPVIWLQPRILYVDVAYGAAVAALMIVILVVKRVGAPEMILAGTIAAAILATKPAGILTSALLLVVWLATAFLRRRGAGGWWAALWPVIVGAATPMVLGLAFYARNLVSFGNPVYPVKASFGPLHFNGVVDFSIFVSGDRGSGLVDPGRLITYLGSIATGMLHGVAKPDYDPRAGGFGYVPLAVILLTAAVLVAQLVLFLLRRRDDRAAWPWRLQLGAVGLVAATLMIQPSAYDARYVVGPTVVLLGAVVLSSFLAVRVVDVVAAVCALVIASVQIAWTEANAYPGLHVAKDLRTLGESAQPSTPGNPWGAGSGSSWLPQDGCSTIAIETLGGVKEWGNAEQTMLSALPYSLYGDRLCNLVVPMELAALEAGTATVDPVRSADFLVLYAGTEDQWRERYPEQAACWEQLQTVPSSGMFPTASSVFVNACR
ncbi:hypothetical protein [Microbacterium sp. Leaf288]|uniref:hypothetical protein n=1 Tax=Microbacterium sp. Leaf288 TaxID=1736323 RepID=UPI0012F7A4A4|nr:hypothetical protein [Microbacterium sp. Leaf288]